MAELLNNNELRRLAADPDYARRLPYLFCPLLSAAIAGRDEKAMEMLISEALKHNISVRTIDEIILQSYLFLGFPAMIEASRLFARIRKKVGTSKRKPSSYSGKDCREWNRLGMSKIQRIYGAAFDRLVEYINSFSPQILTWMVNDGYGRVLSRPGASFKLRELSVVAMLTVTGYENQLKAHIRGTLNNGVEPHLIGSTIRNAVYFCSKSRVKKALDLFARAQSD